MCVDEYMTLDSTITLVEIASMEFNRELETTVTIHRIMPMLNRALYSALGNKIYTDIITLTITSNHVELVKHDIERRYNLAFPDYGISYK